MKLLIDLNIFLDVVQRRQPFYAASAQVLSKIVSGHAAGYLAGHALTTLYYIVRKASGKPAADQLIDWLLIHFEVIGESRAVFVRARSLGMKDFEDATVAASAEHANCDFVVTRNTADFRGGPVRALSPDECLLELVKENSS